MISSSTLSLWITCCLTLELGSTGVLVIFIMPSSYEAIALRIKIENHPHFKTHSYEKYSFHISNVKAHLSVSNKILESKFDSPYIKKFRQYI